MCYCSGCSCYCYCSFGLVCEDCGLVGGILCHVLGLLMLVCADKVVESSDPIGLVRVSEHLSACQGVRGSREIRRKEKNEKKERKKQRCWQIKGRKSAMWWWKKKKTVSTFFLVIYMWHPHWCTVFAAFTVSQPSRAIPICLPKVSALRRLYCV